MSYATGVPARSGGAPAAACRPDEARPGPAQTPWGPGESRLMQVDDDVRECPPAGGRRRVPNRGRWQFLRSRIGSPLAEITILAISIPSSVARAAGSALTGGPSTCSFQADETPSTEAPSHASRPQRRIVQASETSAYRVSAGVRFDFRPYGSRAGARAQDRRPRRLLPPAPRSNMRFATVGTPRRRGAILRDEQVRRREDRHGLSRPPAPRLTPRPRPFALRRPG